MENANLPDESSQPAPAIASAPQRSGWRVAAGVILCIVTLLLTLAMLPFSFCFGIMLQSSSNSSDAPWIIGFIILNILVPVGGTMLAIRIFRGPKRLRAAAGTAGAPVSAPVPRASAKEIEEKLAYLRLVILVVILAHAALILLGFARNPKNIAAMIVPSLLGFVLYQAPYFAVLLGIRQRAESWALSLAFMYSIFSPCLTVLFLLASPWIWRYSSSGAMSSTVLLYFVGGSLVGAAANAVAAVFAWRAWQAAGRGPDSAAQMTLWGAVSAIYLLLLHFSTSLLYRYVHF